MVEIIGNDKITILKALGSVGVAIFKLCEKGIDTRYENILKELEIDINNRIGANKIHDSLIMLCKYNYIWRCSEEVQCYCFNDRTEEIVKAIMEGN